MPKISPRSLAGIALRIGKIRFRVSRKVTERVFQDGIALLSNDVTESASLHDVTSLIQYDIRALLAVPLLVSEQVLGLIYLDTPDATVPI